MEKIYTFNNNTLNSVVKIMCIAAALAMFFIAFAIYRADAAALAVFIGFAVVYVQLPGLFILRHLRLRTNHISTGLIFGFFIGWAFVTAQYFLCELLSSDILLYCLGPVFTIIYVAESFSRKDRHFLLSGFHITKMSAAFCIFIVLVLFYAMVSTQFIHMNPADCASTYMNPDKAYHMGLIDSLSHGWPLESPWVQGRIIKYHVFTELLMAVPVRLFGVSADVAIFSFNPIMTTYVFGLSVYTFFNEMLKNSRFAGICSLAVVLSNLYLTRTIHTSLAFHFAIINDNAVGYGISGAMICVVAFKMWYDKYMSESPCVKELFLLTVLVMLLTGIKGPVAIVIVASIWGTYLIGLILRKVPAKTVLPILVISAGFILIYLTVMGGKGTSNGSGESIFAFGTIANIAFFHDGLIALLKGFGIPKVIRLGVMLVVFMVFFLTAFILPFAIGYIRELILVFSGRKEYYVPRVIVYAAFIAGLAAMFVLNYSGHSQVYFGLVSVFFAPLISFWFFEDMKENRGLLMNTVRIIFIVCLILTSFTLLLQFRSMTNAAKCHSDPDEEYTTYLSITNPEYEAMEWLRTNTSEDALLATDRYSSVPPADYSYEDRWANRFFLYATYSNRFCYIAGSGYNLPAGDWTIRKEMIETNNKLYDVNNPHRVELAHRLGVDYVVVSKRFNDFGDLSCDGYEKCFSNEDIDIYRIR